VLWLRGVRDNWGGWDRRGTKRRNLKKKVTCYHYLEGVLGESKRGENSPLGENRLKKERPYSISMLKLQGG